MIQFQIPRVAKYVTHKTINHPSAIIQITNEKFIKILVLSYVLHHISFIQLFSSLSHDRSKASSKASSPHSTIYSFLLQM
jgi:hypothetical protein